ncbi:homing endonuclease [Acinetobacter phage Acj9]|uniref:Putative Hef-like homing endonuclease n=1 Tax=Acinetobacter phage Acj9 TaxID=760939 RepID=E5EQ11_9CAUD|nr:homing endonuclease [Acinetobacter phage Acj9]ADG60127.1 putative Hef-like homing endonuclease [Acinetobacter phage Acj9]
MFENIMSNGKIKPLNEQKLLSMCSDDDLALVATYPKELPLAYVVHLHNTNTPLDRIKCPICSKFISLKTFKKGILPATCSKSCSSTFNKPKRDKSIVDRFGTLEAKNAYVAEKQRINSLMKHGMSFQATPEFRVKVKATLTERYGVAHNSKLESVKAKRMVCDNGSIVNVMQTQAAKSKRAAKIESFSDERKHEIGSKISQGIKASYHYINRDVLSTPKGSISSLAEAAKCSPMTAYRALIASGQLSKSFTEKEIADYVKSLGFGVVENTRKIISPKELDIYVPEANLAIEYNGLYWHSSGAIDTDKTQSKYHLAKTSQCEAMGINLLHIFENEWIDPIKREIWKSIISHKLGKSTRVYARKCRVAQISSGQAYEFCNDNHLQGGIYGSMYLGLFHGDALVQVAILGKSRFNTKIRLELLRLCSLKFTCVVGGASKLTKGLHFISYGNRRWCSSLSNVYDIIGTKLSYSAPCYWYIVNGDLKHRSSFMKHKLHSKLSSFNPNLSEVQNCYANGLRRIWDCGNIIYEVNNDNHF